LFLLFLFFLFFLSFCVYLVLHSFPTRRSSDLLLGCSTVVDFFIYWWHFLYRWLDYVKCKSNEPFKCILKFTLFKKYQFIMNVLIDRKSTRLNSSHVSISYAVFCLKKKK